MVLSITGHYRHLQTLTSKGCIPLSSTPPINAYSLSHHYHLVPLSSISLSLIHDPSSSITERNIAIISPWPIIIMCPWAQYYYYCIPSIISNDYISPPYSSHILYTHIILIMCPLSITCCPTQYFTHIYVWLSKIIYFLTLIYNI